MEVSKGMLIGAFKGMLYEFENENNRNIQMIKDSIEFLETTDNIDQETLQQYLDLIGHLEDTIDYIQ